MTEVFVVMIYDSTNVVLCFDHDPLDEEIVMAYNEEMEEAVEDISELGNFTITETILRQE